MSVKKCADCGGSTGVRFPSDSLFPCGESGNEYCITCLTNRETCHMLALLPTDDTDPEWERLTEKEQKFLDIFRPGSFSDNFERYGRVTKKQFTWLSAIYERLKGDLYDVGDK